MDEPTKIRLVDNRDDLFLLFVKDVNGNFHLEGIYESEEMARFETEEGEIVLIVKMKMNGLVPEKSNIIYK